MPKIDPFALQPEDAVAYFRAKGYRTSWNWQDVLKEEHAKAFTVAHCMKMDILQDIRQAYDKALAEGVSLSRFKRDLMPILQAKGWWGKKAEISPKTGLPEVYTAGTPWRLNTIYRTNMATSYAAGRYQQMVDNIEDQPLWMYDAVNDSRTRPTHAALDGQVFPADDPFWNTHFPPSGFNCRCEVTPMSESQAARYAAQNPGITANASSAGMNFPPPDEGWDYNPGKAEHQLDVWAWEKVKKLKKEIRQEFVRTMSQTDVRDAPFSAWINEVVKLNKLRTASSKMTNLGKRVTTAGWIKPDIIEWLQVNQGITLDSPIILATDDSIFHAERTAKRNPVPLSELKNLPEILRHEDAYFDSKTGDLFFVKRMEDDKVLKFVVLLNQTRARIPGANFFTTATSIVESDLKNNRFKKIKKTP